MIFFRLLNSAILLVILCGGIHLSDGDKLECLFEFVNFGVVANVYTCYVTSLDNKNNNKIIDGFTGAHKEEKDCNNVKAIYLHKTNTKYIPENIGTLFKLTAFRMWNGQLTEIKTKDFNGMEKLENLDLGVNNLPSLPSNAFITLPKLKQIYLYSNRIKELPVGLFSNNLELEGVHLDKNQIKFIDSEMFSKLTKLNNVNMDYNICVHKGYTGATEIVQLKKDIKLYCNVPNDSIDFKLKEIIMKNLKSERAMKDLIIQESMKVKEDNQKMMKQLLNAIDAKDELRTKLTEALEQKLKTEIAMTKLKEQQQMKNLELNNVTNEKAALKKEIKELKKQLFHSNENQQKMTIEVSNLNKEVFELKQKHQTDKIVFGELRTKLIKANEQLASCIID